MAAEGDRLRLVGLEGSAVRGIAAGSRLPGRLYLRPAHQVGGVGRIAVRAEDIIGLRRRLPHDAGVMHSARCSL